jgi:hypothetical protein
VWKSESALRGLSQTPFSIVASHHVHEVVWFRGVRLIIPLIRRSTGGLDRDQAELASLPVFVVFTAVQRAELPR